MPNPAASLTEDEVREAIALPKVIVDDVSWIEKPENSCFLVARPVLLDPDGATIPGITVELCVRRGRFEDDCRFDFGLFKIKGSRRLRAYQINVTPWERVSHREKSGEEWRGPHQHFGERAEKFGSDVTLTCADHELWFREFLRRANIRFGGTYVPPMSTRLL